MKTKIVKKKIQAGALAKETPKKSVKEILAEKKSKKTTPSSSGKPWEKSIASEKATKRYASYGIVVYKLSSDGEAYYCVGIGDPKEEDSFLELRYPDDKELALAIADDIYLNTKSVVQRRLAEERE